MAMTKKQVSRNIQKRTGVGKAKADRAAAKFMRKQRKR